MQCAGVKKDSQKSSGLPTVGNSYQAKKDGDQEEEGNVYLLYQNSKDKWFLASDLSSTIDGDLYSINLDYSVQEYKLLLIRVKSNITATQVPNIANGLQRSLSRKTVKFILKQNSTETEAFLECCRADKMDDVLLIVYEACNTALFFIVNVQRLKQKGFTNGPSPSDDIVIKEGQCLEVRFRGNVKGTEECVPLIYNSHVNTSSSDVQVRVVDKFAQHGLDLYRGHVQLFEIVPAQLEEDPKKKKDQKQIKKKEEETEKGEIEFERKLLTELVVSLPKEERNLERIKKAPYKMASFGILNEELFDEIAKELGDEWRLVALKLGISNARIQDMELMSNSKTDGNIIKDMLVRWFKGTNRSADKVNILYWALFEGGRDDLADKIFQRNCGVFNEEESKPSSASEIFDKKINKAFTKIVTNALINEEWKILSRKLTLTDNDLNCIEDKYNKNGTNKDKTLEALYTWKKSKGSEATPSRLISALKDSGFSDMSVQIKGIFAS
ncbi:DgyrCDS11964 [Dimorphilus gyrociliatus]|uniref:DgyrCDS11964 n=1 Tax=Dimorphilus gyrociliatus TaxID=2664684 RepID=A0A7I8W635_9ANNE|nr:DgyrCDS11964 [Dimorphilus gyrociliatus]